MNKNRHRLIEELVTVQVTCRRSYAVADSSPPAAPAAEIVTTAEELPASRPGLAKIAPVVDLASRRRAG